MYVLYKHVKHKFQAKKNPGEHAVVCSCFMNTSNKFHIKNPGEYNGSTCTCNTCSMNTSSTSFAPKNPEEHVVVCNIHVIIMCFMNTSSTNFAQWKSCGSV